MVSLSGAIISRLGTILLITKVKGMKFSTAQGTWVFSALGLAAVAEKISCRAPYTGTIKPTVKIWAREGSLRERTLSEP